MSDTLAAVLRHDPDRPVLPATVPTGLRNLMRRCLEKDSTVHFPDMAVVRFLLDEPTAVVSPTPRRAAFTRPQAADRHERGRSAWMPCDRVRRVDADARRSGRAVRLFIALCPPNPWPP